MDEKVVTLSLENLFFRRYSNFKFEKVDSPQANTAQSKLFVGNIGR